VRYRCGLQPGDRIRLKKELVIREDSGRPTGESHPVGDVWIVLPDGCSNCPGDLWLQQSDGQEHTWSDDESVFEFFEKVSAQ